MHMFLTAGATALLLGALVTELSTRLWPDNHLALLLACTAALFLGGLLNARLAAQRVGTRQNAGASTGASRTAPARPAARSEQRPPRPQAPRPSRASDSPIADGPREQGTVKWFSRTKGFGFIIRPDDSEVFVHQRSIRMIGSGDARRRPLLNDGQEVSYVIAVRDKGPQAEDVTPLSERDD